jgi:putative NADH-flavin reductase
MKLLVLFALYALVLTAALARAGYRGRVVPAHPAPPPRERPSRILIIGATGGTGRQLVAQALERGYAVTALARNPAKLDLAHPHLVIARGDVLDYRAVEAAMRGQDAVVSALGHKRFFYPTRILSEGTRNVLRAMDAHGVARLVCATSLGLGDSAGRLGLFYTFFIIPMILPFYFWDKTRQEQIIARSACAWTIVRPGVLTDEARRGGYRCGSDLGGFIGTVRIARADVADFMLAQLESDTFLRTAVGVAQRPTS